MPRSTGNITTAELCLLFDYVKAEGQSLSNITEAKNAAMYVWEPNIL